MFTGIIEEIGVIQDIKKENKSSKIMIKANKVLDKTKVGESIATNGVCLTVTKINKDGFEADIMAETLRQSNIGSLNIGDKVNLERAVSLESRLGGHIVSGHIDGLGEIRELEREDNAIWITVKTPLEFLKYIVKKGSITIDGVSLTVAYVDDTCFKVSIIPHTLNETTLINKRVLEKVNLECDLIGKYIEKLLKGDCFEEKENRDSIDKNFLKNNGFL